SLAYMSLEQLEAIDPEHDRTPDSLDGRSDLFSLGVLLGELLTGERPYGQSSDGAGHIPRLNELIAARQHVPDCVSIDSVRDGWGLSEIIQRCLQPDRENRFSSGLELAQEIELCLQPDAKRLLSSSPTGWRSWARRFPVFGVTMLTLIPNLIGAVFNFL